MIRKAFAAALLSGLFSTSALAQPSTDTIAAELAAMRARIAELEAEVARLTAAER